MPAGQGRQAVALTAALVYQPAGQLWSGEGQGERGEGGRGKAERTVRWQDEANRASWNQVASSC